MTSEIKLTEVDGVVYPLLNVCGEEVPVAYISEFARGPNGLCAFCDGDPCNENGTVDTPVSRFYAKNDWANTCPCCNGRPS